MATRALDGGALGIVMPHVDTADEAREIISHLKYPPIGHRSIAGQQAHFDFRTVAVGDLTRTLNAATMITVMVETPTAVENVDAIAAIPGVDAVLIGTNDLATELGIPGQFNDPRIVAAFEQVIAGCKRYNKWPGMGGIRDEETTKRYIAMGMRMILAGVEAGMLIAAGSARTAFMRSCV
jgi:2-keto-3-deoxy-L-rhamnonate aldolase RhmA